MTHDTNALYLAVDPTGKYLLISYQNGGPSGRDGHDAFEAIDIATRRVVATIHGPPMVGGEIAASPLNGNVWINIWDACETASYDRLGCAIVPGRGWNVFRAGDYTLLRSFATPGRFEGRPLFLNGGKKALLSGNPLRVVDTATFRVLESVPVPGIHVTDSAVPADGKTIFVVRGNELWLVEPESKECANSPHGLVGYFAFDGSPQDSMAEHVFEFNGGVEYVPGIAGQALRVAAGGSAKLRPRSEWRFGDSNTTIVSQTFWFRSPSGATWTVARGEPTERIFALQGNGSRVVFGHAVDSVSAEAESGKWHLAAFVRNGPSITVFIDGVRVGEVAYPADVDGRIRNFIIEGPVEIDELMTYGRAMGEVEIRAMFETRQRAACRP